jgi:hypothetical protein
MLSYVPVALRAIGRDSGLGVQLEGYTDAQNLPEFVDKVTDYQNTVETAVATAYAKAIAGTASCPSLLAMLTSPCFSLCCCCWRGNTCGLHQKLCL